MFKYYHNKIKIYIIIGNLLYVSELKKFIVQFPFGQTKIDELPKLN